MSKVNFGTYRYNGIAPLLCNFRNLGTPYNKIYYEDIALELLVRSYNYLCQR